MANEAATIEKVSIPLGGLRRGTKGHIEAILDAPDQDGQSAADHLRSLGFAEDLAIEVLHHSPFGGDPFAVRVGAMTIALRRAEANLVMVIPEVSGS